MKIKFSKNPSAIHWPFFFLTQTKFIIYIFIPEKEVVLFFLLHFWCNLHNLLATCCILLIFIIIMIFNSSFNKIIKLLLLKFVFIIIIIIIVVTVFMDLHDFFFITSSKCCWYLNKNFLFLFKMHLSSRKIIRLMDMTNRKINKELTWYTIRIDLCGSYLHFLKQYNQDLNNFSLTPMKIVRQIDIVLGLILLQDMSLSTIDKIKINKMSRNAIVYYA
jgi:hypothetical protein